MRQVQFLSFVFQKLLSIVMDAGKSAMIYCDIKVNVIMTLFVTCRFADIIEKYDINKDREYEKFYPIHFGGRECCHVAVCEDL